MNFLGLDLDGDTLNIAIINRKRHLIYHKSFNVSNVKQIYTSIENQFKIHNITTGLRAKSVLIKSKILKIGRKGLKKTIPFQLRSCNSLPPEETIALPFIHSVKKNLSNLFFYITTKNVIALHLSKLKQLNVDPDYITCHSQALNRFAEYTLPEVKQLYVLHLGTNESTIVYIKDNITTEHHQIKIGFNDLLKAYKETAVDIPYNFKIDFTNISNRYLNLKEKITTLENEIKRSLLNFFALSNKEKTPLLVTGQVKHLKNFNEYILSQNANIISETLNIKQPFLLEYAICLGLSLEGNITDNNGMQFRQDSFIPRKHLKKTGSFLLSFLMLSLAFSLSALFFSNSVLSKKNEQIEKQLTHLEHIEEIANKNNSCVSFNERTNQISEKIKNEIAPSPHLSCAPKVSHLLSWINNHPLINSTDSNLAKIESIDYKLITSQSKKKNENQVEVSLILLITDPDTAHSFHKSLNEDKSFIDQSREIRWNENSAYYETCFYLKNLTPKDVYDN